MSLDVVATARATIAAPCRAGISRGEGDRRILEEDESTVVPADSSGRPSGFGLLEQRSWTECIEV